ncbi:MULTISPECIES: ArsA family ATPase [unclassified Streptomyces]|uniref:ArsA family ATPase n=1 Tax=unclassified Streptomyces TaxID=2593676 RepID=UPI0006F9E843|nr:MULTISPECIES: ArsA family ATPase [unclassified Streptomyces]KQX45565.1 anion-transporting ATPase [Streptomyces sp. Root1304]KRA79509.1 anion-transporting ATPase [Streptomyces sp. Root66D1]
MTEKAAGTGEGLDAVPVLELDPLIDDPGTRIVVCCGAGGVGKTTTAAALGVRAAERGRRVVVLTIDPARRLAQSMGIDSLDNTPRKVEGIKGSDGGELHAMMLDMKRTFDEIVEAHADPERARAILENPFYQSLSAGFAGTQEYMAMEKLGQLRARDEWDLIVVDTPPSRSALDFLDAPKRLGSFLDGKFIKLLMAPAKVGGRAGMKFLNVGMSMMTGTLGKLLGGQFLKDVQTFVAAMDTMFGGFRTRADATYKLLQAPGTAFLVVATPERDALREAAYFVERLAAEDMPLAGLVLNRVHGSGAVRLSAERARAAAENLEEGRIVDQEDGQTRRSGSPATDPEPSELATAAAHSVSEAAPTAEPAQETDTDATAYTDVDTHVDPPADAATDDADTDTDARASADVDTDVRRLTAGLLRLHAERMRVLTRERRTRDRFTALHPEVAVTEVAALPGDVHDLAGLRAIGDRLTSGRTPSDRRVPDRTPDRV